MGQRESDKRRITLELSEDVLSWIGELKSQLGMRSRGAVLEYLLRTLRDQPDDGLDDVCVDDERVDDKRVDDDRGDHDHSDSAQEPGADRDGVSEQPATGSDPAKEESACAEAESSGLDESAAIVLIHSDLVSLQDQVQDQNETPERKESAAPAAARRAPASAAAPVGIQLPGFVRRQAREIQRSLRADAKASSSDQTLALVAAADLEEALQRARQHWQEVYGQPATDAVVDAAVLWLARDIWPQSDHSDGRPFTWTLARRVLVSLAPSWPDGDPQLDTVMVAAGILEDPFSASTLALRIPTLITRFVQRHRSRQKRTTSFDAIDQSMSVHGALRLLQLPTVAERPYTLKEIREAYRDQAQLHHPDAGGSADAMRRLNEAYQFLKERYRRAA